ncbi:MAG TPA: hypothetical protein EYQ44_05970 [Porticoccaceae bacterium]|nr:hypothetical protein [Porticoccaceae bacterium]
MTEAAEQTENRLMMLLDQERQAAKESTAKLTDQLAEMRDKAQSHREKTIELEATIRELKGQYLSVYLGREAGWRRPVHTSSATGKEIRQAP